MEENYELHTRIPILGKIYLFINDEGLVSAAFWSDTEKDHRRLAMRNVFQTRREALFQARRLRVIAELKEYAREFVYDEENFYLCYDNDDKVIVYGSACWIQDNNLYFPSREIARQAVKAVGEELVKRYYLGVSRWA